MTIEIRPVRPEEYEEAGRVTADAYRRLGRPGADEGWRGYLDHLADVADRAQRTTVLVAVEEGDIVGTVTLELDRRVEEGEDHREARRLPPHESHVRMLGVRPDAQGRGIGRALMDACIDIARENGKTLMTLHTTHRMTAAHRMYESMGFVREPDWQVSEDFTLMSYSLEIDREG
jgi:ribosomal protein S18 acetylase RimI-like enzyme